MKSATSNIVIKPEVHGGRPHIEGTRISVRMIAIQYKQGHSAEEISDLYHQISLAQIYSALAYYHAHRRELDRDILAEEKAYNSLSGKHHISRKTG